MKTTSQHLEQIGYLVRGELVTDMASRQKCAYDGSIFTILPEAVLFPKDAGDIQAVLHYLYIQSSMGEIVPSLTMRGRGSDQAGGPLGLGIVVDTTRHLQQILEIGKDFVRVEPGVRYGELQKELKKRGRYLPPYPASLEICTIGGAVSNNSSGEKTVKYGDTRDYVIGLKVILSNGENVYFSSMSLDEADRVGKKRTMEGKVYREILALLDMHKRENEVPAFQVTKNATGYCVWEIETHGHFDLTKLLVGSQGTLGVITEITLRTEPFPKDFVLIAGYFASIESAALATGELLPLAPSALEIVDKNLLRLVEERQPGHLQGLVPDILPEIVLVIEFDDKDDKKRLAKGRTAQTILEKYAYHYKEEKKPSEQDRLWDLRRSSAAVIWTVPGDMKALPIVEDGVVPPELLPEFFRKAYALFDTYDLRIAIWGHAGDANLHMQPFMNLSDPKDRAKIWPFVEEFHALILAMGGCISAEHNDGLLRSPYIKAQYGEELYEIFRSVKHIFDPHSILNPGKKIDVSLESIKPLLRDSYNLNHLVNNAEEINR